MAPTALVMRAAAGLRRVRRLLMLSVFACVPAVADATEVAVPFPRTVRIAAETEDLTLNGAGERSILFFRIYSIGLYLPQRRTSLDGVLALRGPKRVQLFMHRELSAKQVRDHLAKRIADGTQPAEMAVMQGKMDDISRIIDSVKVLKKDDMLMLDYVPKKGTIVKINDVAHGDPIAGDEFFHALLRIWLGERARSHGLRDALLGRAAG